MRMASDRDQAIVKAAVPDAGGRQIEFLASLAIREAIAFGESVALPTRIRFKDLAKEFVSRSQSSRRLSSMRPVIDSAFMQSVVRRWRQTTTAGPRPKAGLVSLEQAVTAVVGLSPKLQPRKMD